MLADAMEKTRAVASQDLSGVSKYGYQFPKQDSPRRWDLSSLESKRRSIEWRQLNPFRNKPHREIDGWSLRFGTSKAFMSSDNTINFDSYVTTLSKFRAWLLRNWPHLKKCKVLLQHENSNCHIHLKTRKQSWRIAGQPYFIQSDLAGTDRICLGP